ncbi:hypothetical protein [Pedobacter sp. MC2016-14]|nr:hypothetical protein [Pedobacter sp. MC2016-14]
MRSSRSGFVEYNDGTTPQYNGNIANQLWGIPGNLSQVTVE